MTLKINKKIKPKFKVNEKVKHKKTKKVFRIASVYWATNKKPFVTYGLKGQLGTIYHEDEFIGKKKTSK